MSVPTNVEGRSPRTRGRLYHSHSDEALHTHRTMLPFLTEDSFTDVILTVEGKRIFTNRSLLAYASPVFAKRFLTEFKDQKKVEIKLPYKKYLHIVELISYLHPGVNKPLTGEFFSKHYKCSSDALRWQHRFLFDAEVKSRRAPLLLGWLTI